MIAAVLTRKWKKLSSYLAVFEIFQLRKLPFRWCLDFQFIRSGCSFHCRAWVYRVFPQRENIAATVLLGVHRLGWVARKLYITTKLNWKRLYRCQLIMHSDKNHFKIKHSSQRFWLLITCSYHSISWSSSVPTTNCFFFSIITRKYNIIWSSYEL